MFKRSEKVAEAIHEEISSLLIKGVKDPRIGMVTIHAVEVTPDYAHANVFFSLLVGDPHECETALNEAAGYLRNGLFKRLQIHTVPTLHFVFDRTTERAAELTMLINQANATRAKED
ncbi:MAG TPA: 30S ribosome-binding factor RbfA [Albitalea sp.]|nr:30S ribosome-binding factor RbfA [Albitalea sp.]